jgi:predicted ATPase with chaperone activity
MIQRYRSKVSGPLLDRIDLHIEVPPVSSPDLLDSIDGESSAAVASRVEAARRLQLARFEGRDGLYANGQMGALVSSRAENRADDRGPGGEREDPVLSHRRGDPVSWPGP